MTSAYITDQDAVIRTTHERLVIIRDGAEVGELQIPDLESLHIFGRVEITTPAIQRLMEADVEAAFYTIHGELLGQLTPPRPKNIQLRIKQYDLFRNNDFVLPRAKSVIAEKLDACVDILEQGRRNSPDVPNEEPIERIREIGSKIEPAGSIDQLFGLEGSSAAIYFPALGKLFGKGFDFSHRERQPPPDPVNALLSFGYVLVGAKLQSLLDGIGLDPYLGFFHQPRDRRPSLALDILEPFRPDFVDRLTLRLINLGTLKLDDFQQVEGKGVRLTRDGMKKYFAAFEKMLDTTASRKGVEHTWLEWFRIAAENTASDVRNALT